MSEYIPFTADEFVQAAYGLELEINKPQKHTRARASGLGACAREQAYSYAGVPESDPPQDDPDRAPGILTTEQGRHIEDLSCAVIDQLPQGLTVVNRQIELPVDFPVSGHPDGELVRKDGLPMEDGLKWGFEHKHLGRFSYMKTYKLGWESANAGYMAQLILYGRALGWDKASVVVLAQDSSSTKFERDRSRYAKKRTPANAWAVRDDWNPKVQVFNVDLRPWYGFVPQLYDRADQLARTVEQMGPAAVRREGDGIARDMGGKQQFPCGYCAYSTRCNIDGNGTVGIVPLPAQLGAS